ncbi:type VI secretion system tube protein TssD [Rhodoflexus caldus]|uniref:type VI secretion system tube protein TssD n=1 Tax=Rhodoflexus caldus TaxID=2891236 RepID=UPI00202A057E|nr:type VI secretion system tube protein TssD [Rhodoflexus caldus]
MPDSNTHTSVPPLRASLTLSESGAELPVLRFSYRLYQEADVQGRPITGVRSGLINIVSYGHYALEKTDFIVWAAQAGKQQDGYITLFYDEGRIYKKIEFERAYCVRFKETLQAGSSLASLLIEIGITASAIRLGQFRHQNPW